MQAFQKKVGFLFVLSSILNVVWIFLWQYEYVTYSVIPICLLLATLAAIYLRVNIGNSAAPLKEKLAVHLPFSVYLGWITVATIADVSAALVYVKGGGFNEGAVNWAILALVAVLVITLLFISTRKDIAYALVIVWAVIGIGVKQRGNHNIVTIVEIDAVIIAVAIVVAVLVARFKHR
jgi:hypothetical protein